MLVQEIMTRQPTTVSRETPLRHAAQVLVDLQISSLPVLDGHGRLCGVVSEADLIRDAFVPDARGHMVQPAPNEAATPTLVEQVMTHHAVTVHEATDLADAADLMASAGVKSLPVVDEDGHLRGVVSRSDLVRVRARGDDVIAKDVSTRLVAMGCPRWSIEVTDGQVEILGPSSVSDQSIARIVASAVPGVRNVRVR
jgi:CBS domain-containing protein